MNRRADAVNAGGFASPGGALGRVLALAATVTLAVSAVVAGAPPVRAGTIAFQGSLADLVDGVKDAVVNVRTRRAPQRPDFADPFAWFFGGDPRSRADRTSLGSGFIVDDDGHILTNHHVVAGADEIAVLFADGHEARATLVGADEATDIAVLRIDPFPGMKAVRLGDSDALRVGDPVAAIGNPFGYGHTVTAGIVSAKGRVLGFGPYDAFIQTDASINPGNSGGPLFDLKGRVVGINTAVSSRGQGLGFAVPAATALQVFPQLVARGTVTRGWAGWRVADHDGTPVLEAVWRDGPAFRAGLVAGDRLLAVGGADVRAAGDVPRALGATPPGAEVGVRVEREGRPLDASLVLDDRDAWAERAAGPAVAVPALGITVRALPPDRAERGARGLEVFAVASDAPARGWFEEGDVLLALGGVPLERPDDLLRVTRGLGRGDPLAIDLVRGGRRVRARVVLPR